MTDSVFTKIVKREIPAEIIYEDDDTIVIPDKFPSMKGQLVVVPKKQISYVFDLDEHTYDALMRTVKRAAQALDKTFATKRTCVIIEGFEIPHVHVRLYPCPTNELKYAPRHEATDEELRGTADRVRKAL